MKTLPINQLPTHLPIPPLLRSHHNPFPSYLPSKLSFKTTQKKNLRNYQARNGYPNHIITQKALERSISFPRTLCHSAQNPCQEQKGHTQKKFVSSGIHVQCALVSLFVPSSIKKNRKNQKINRYFWLLERIEREKGSKGSLVEIACFRGKMLRSSVCIPGFRKGRVRNLGMTGWD